MNSTNTIYLTKRGMKDLKKKIAHLEHDHNAIIAQLHDIDKTEAHDERLARAERLAALEIVASELSDKQQILATAKPLPRKRDRLKVAIGSVVDLLDTNGRIIRYTLVDSLEADPSTGRISILSPLGKSLLGKQLRDVVQWSAHFGKRELQLIAIS
jgi:transcription elongation factor GreA